MSTDILNTDILISGFSSAICLGWIVAALGAIMYYDKDETPWTFVSFPVVSCMAAALPILFLSFLMR